MKPSNYAITEWPEKTLFTRQETAQILGIGLSTLDSSSRTQNYHVR